MNVEINRIFYLLAEEQIDIKEAKSRVLNLFDVVCSEDKNKQNEHILDIIKSPRILIH